MKLGYSPGMRHTPWLLVPCVLICGWVTGCSANKGPATHAYLRGYQSAYASLASQIRDLPRISPPVRPAEPPNPTSEELRIFDGMTRIYPIAVSQFYGSAFERCQALTQLYSQTQDRIAAMDTAGVEPDAVQFVGLQSQALGQRREFFTQLGRLIALNRDALARRHGVDDLDETLSILISGSVSALAHGEDDAAIGGVLAGLKDTAGAASKRLDAKSAVNEQITHATEAVTELQRGVAACQAEQAKLTAGLQAKYPGQDWTELVPKPKQGDK